jgi:molybdate transport system ATP-binding protein
MSVLEFRCRLHYASGFALDAEWSTDTSVIALYGPSGSGKTTILSLIAGLRTPESGHIRLGERTLYDSASAVNLPPEARRVGYVFQHHLLFPHLSVRENLLYGWKRRAASARSIEPTAVIDVLELGDVLERRPATLSGGQAQRVALGRALLCTPELLLLDEPLASIDDELRAQVLGYIEQVLAKWSIPTVYVSHDASEVRRLAGAIVHVRHGQVTAVERV